jgi:hypothetical protein
MKKVAEERKNYFRECNPSRTLTPFQKNTKHPLIYAFAYLSCSTQEPFSKRLPGRFCFLKPFFGGFITLLRYL